MAPSKSEGAAKPPPRAVLTVVFYHAKCRSCAFDTLSPREAHVHCLSQEHPMSVSKAYTLEPPE